MKHSMNETKSNPIPFGDILRRLLDTRGLSQKQLGDDLNISPGAIGNYVRGLREPDYQTLVRIAAYFEVSTDTLLDFHPSYSRDYKDSMLLQVFHHMTEEQKDIFIEQGKVFARSNADQKKRTASAS